ncbi:MAG: demethoxyubiquinone hydroxylase family protein [bacterium]|nr:demethoxyubiquinone hydroxylase family protein [bacterium]MDT8367375.1 demethoxyubiquinone hydroxylase family protein [bacterium]
MPANRQIVRILKKLFNLEVMAVQIYGNQLGAMTEAGERSMMLAAMENEEHHRDTFRSLLQARNVAPSPLHALYWVVGQTLGRTTSLFGRKAVLRGDIAFEDKASREYAEFLRKEKNFTEEEKAFIGEFLEDEKRHSANWRRLLTE